MHKYVPILRSLTEMSIGKGPYSFTFGALKKPARNAGLIDYIAVKSSAAVPAAVQGASSPAVPRGGKVFALLLRGARMNPKPTLTAELIAEFLGTFVLILLGNGGVAVLVLFPST